MFVFHTWRHRELVIVAVHYRVRPSRYLGFLKWPRYGHWKHIIKDDGILHVLGGKKYHILMFSSERCNLHFPPLKCTMNAVCFNAICKHRLAACQTLFLLIVVFAYFLWVGGNLKVNLWYDYGSYQTKPNHLLVTSEQNHTAKNKCNLWLTMSCGSYAPMEWNSFLRNLSTLVRGLP